MKACIHIAFYFKENRLNYLDRMLKEYNNYPCEVDIYIHTNVQFPTERWNLYDNGVVTTIVHDFTNGNPMFLTWKCRELYPKQLNNYDVFMYSEDDILVPKKAFDYWLQNKDMVNAENYNLGFFRIQVDNTVDYEYITDAQESTFDRNIISIGNKKFLVNKFSYCAFWIYDKKEMEIFMSHPFYDLDYVKNDPLFNVVGIREVSAWGLHLKHPYYNFKISRYKDTVFLLDDNEELNKDCRIYHLDEAYHYVSNGTFCCAKFENCIRK